jgi:hypothetical protein
MGGRWHRTNRGHRRSDGPRFVVAHEVCASVLTLVSGTSLAKPPAYSGLWQVASSEGREREQPYEASRSRQDAVRDEGCLAAQSRTALPLLCNQTADHSVVWNSRLRRGMTDRSLDEETRACTLGGVAGWGSAYGRGLL